MPPVKRPRRDHTVSRKNIDPDALKVIYRLRQHGYTAYLVGGGVRDLLLGRTPKDFDVATDAHPNQIRRLFRNSFLIGRRFRLAHIRFGDNIVETSTFRRAPELPPHGAAPAARHEGRENTFGTAREDAFRRDFTVNALFYDVGDFSVLDYVGGLEDLDARLIRCIGDPEARFREDPVRMLRAVRFAARLGFRIEPEAWGAIRKHCREIAKASPPRLLEEIVRLFACRSGERALRLMWQTGLMRVLLPETAECLDAGEAGTGRAEGETAAPGEAGTGMLWGLLHAMDAKADPIEPPPADLIFCVLLYAPFRRRIRQAHENGEHPAHLDVARAVAKPVADRFRMPKKMFYCVVKILAAQARFGRQRRRGRFSRQRLMAQEIFPAALDLHELRVRAGDADAGSLAGWQRLWRER